MSHSEAAASVKPRQLTLKLEPQSRVEVIEISRQVTEHDEAFGEYPRAAYCSHHTTAGFLEQNFQSRLNHSAETVETFVTAFRKLFPPDADYNHDKMELREELTAEQKQVEPRNADSHLTYIGAGLQNCVTYTNDPLRPVYFVELDGVNGKLKRTRRATVIGYNRDQLVDQTEVVVPMSSHPMDSVNLRDARLGLFDYLESLLEDYGIQKGRIDLSLAGEEQNAGLTVNEYETLLMRHDLIEVLRDPMRYMAQKGYHMIKDPLAIPTKAKNYAKYDLVQVLNELIDKLGLNESFVERVLDKFLAVPASRFLRMKRSVSLLVSDDEDGGAGKILQGQYQSPILVQWKRSNDDARRLRVKLTRFE
ncbi:MAG: hypothetical protein R3178_05790 [Rhodothermales bacterium]|nr:hypothetical protein [Rhodothermales bacterium]